MSDLFSQEPETPVIPENPLEALVGEGKKFKDPAELARAKYESDLFIEQLKREAAEMRKELTEKLTMDEIMTQIRSSNTQPSQETTPSPDNRQNGTDSVSKVELEQLIQSQLTAREAANKAAENKKAVETKLHELWGDSAATKLNQKARELGVTTEYLGNLATTSPAAFYATVGINLNQQKPPQMTPPSSRATTIPVVSGERNSGYYENLKATNPKKYFSQETRMQQYKDMMANPEAFGITV